MERSSVLISSTFSHIQCADLVWFVMWFCSDQSENSSGDLPRRSRNVLSFFESKAWKFLFFRVLELLSSIYLLSSEMTWYKDTDKAFCAVLLEQKPHLPRLSPPRLRQVSKTYTYLYYQMCFFLNPGTTHSFGVLSPYQPRSPLSRFWIYGT